MLRLFLFLFLVPFLFLFPSSSWRRKTDLRHLAAIAAAADVVVEAIGDVAVVVDVAVFVAPGSYVAVAAADVAVVPSSVLPLQRSLSMTRYCGDVAVADDVEGIVEYDSPDYYCPSNCCYCSPRMAKIALDPDIHKPLLLLLLLLLRLLWPD